MKKASQAHIFGEAIGATLCGVPVNRMDFELGVVEQLEERGAPFHRKVASLVADAYEALDRKTWFGYSLHTKLANVSDEDWTEGHSLLMRPAYRAFLEASEAGMTKEAGTLAQLASGAANLSVQALRQLMFAGLLTGSGLGTIYWGLNRNVGEDAADNEALDTKVKLYDRLTREIESAMPERHRAPEVEEPEEPQSIY